MTDALTRAARAISRETATQCAEFADDEEHMCAEQRNKRPRDSYHRSFWERARKSASTIASAIRGRFLEEDAPGAKADARAAILAFLSGEDVASHLRAALMTAQMYSYDFSAGEIASISLAALRTLVQAPDKKAETI